jgi:hypothetical protein
VTIVANGENVEVFRHPGHSGQVCADREEPADGQPVIVNARPLVPGVRPPGNVHPAILSDGKDIQMFRKSGY